MKTTTDALVERDRNLPNEAQGLYRKFEVTRTDGSSAAGGKHHGCEYFVLDVDHDPHAKAALSAYADAVQATHPHLADDMRRRYALARAEQAEPPILPETGAYIIVYDDADKPQEVFARSGARDAALRRFQQISGMWNANLFVKIMGNRRDEDTPNATPPAPTPKLEPLTDAEITESTKHIRMDQSGARWGIARAIEAAHNTKLSANVQAVPEGWVCVPMEPTREMCAAAVKFANGNAVYKNVAAAALEIEEGIYGEAFAAMIAAAPPLPKGGV